MKTLVVAPHPDDETLGCGGTLLRRRGEGAELAWLIVTQMSVAAGWPAERVAEREREVATVTEIYGFRQVFNCRLPPAGLDRLPISEVVGALSIAFKAFGPEEVFLPHPADAHTDHRVVFEAAAACTKWFRYPSVRRVLAYETLSETDCALPRAHVFRPQVFIDISSYVEDKIRVMGCYRSELDTFPFPRSVEAIRALAAVRGAAAGYAAAEAFELLRERS